MSLSSRWTRRGFWPSSSRSASSRPSTWRFVPEPALDGEPHGLVEDEDVLVLVERDRLEEVALVLVLAALRDRAAAGRASSGGMRIFWPASSRSLRLRALAVDAQLALADDALDMREGELRKARDEEAVDPHLGLVGIDLKRLHAGRQNLLRLRLGLAAGRLRFRGGRLRLPGARALSFRCGRASGRLRMRTARTLCAAGAGALNPSHTNFLIAPS